MNKGIFKANKAVLAAIMTLVVVVPGITFAGNSKKLYVNGSVSNSATQDGSKDHPYKTIGKALDKAKKNYEVHIAEGTYKENIRIPEGVEVIGKHRNKVTIEAKSVNEPVVYMRHKTMLNNVTLTKGEYGIRINDNAKASVDRVIVKNSDKDGIKIGRGKVEDKYLVTISNSVIKDNDRNGIFAEKRKLVLVENDIIDNHKDGVELSKGSKAWMKGNQLNDNSGSGLVLTLDGSDIFTKKNTMKSNKREGLEVESFGEAGKIEMSNAKITKNGRYGIAKVARTAHLKDSAWKGLVIVGSDVSNNKSGNISSIIRVK